MGAVGLNGAAANAQNPRERLSLAENGWTRWAPVNAAAIGVHLVGGTGLLLANRERVRNQKGAGTTVVLKTVLTGAALGITAWSGKLNRDVAAAESEPAHGATEPTASTSPKAAAAQKQLRLTQWLIPATTGALIVLGAIQGEEQRPGAQLRGRAKQVTKSLPSR
ncbi:MAG: hypothetical protein ABIQ59_09455 [Nocardioidaceae bacterium]